MNDNRLEWASHGIEQALAAGGVELETYRRPGFTGGLAVRRSEAAVGGSGQPVEEGDFGLVWDRTAQR